MSEEALTEFQKEREVSKGANFWAELGAGFAYIQMDKPDEAQKMLDELLERSKNEHVSPFLLACLHFMLGKNDEGFKLSDKAYNEHDHWLSMIQIVRFIDGIHSDPRYIALLKKINLKE